MNNPKIGAVVVLYKPDLKVTKQVIKSISSQVEEICIVDNTPNQNIKEEFLSIINIHYLSLGENKGIAAAQNIGISYLKNKNFEFVLFCDQDSLAPSDTVKKLFDGYRILKNEGIRIATVGTRAINKLTGEKYRSRTKELGNPLNPKNYRNQYCKITECYSVMSSISLTLINNFEEVGPFDETLFIDGVDDEWCWRAWHFKKLRSFIIENATIMHMLGEKDSFLGKNISISTPFRIYFQFRNFIILARKDTTPRFWKRNNLIKYLIKMIYYPLFVSPRLSYLNKIISGIKDGFNNHKIK